MRPGMRQMRVLPSMQRTLLLLAPSRWSSTPITSSPCGVRTRVFCSSSLMLFLLNYRLFIKVCLCLCAGKTL